MGKEVDFVYLFETGFKAFKITLSNLCNFVSVCTLQFVARQHPGISDKSQVSTYFL